MRRALLVVVAVAACAPPPKDLGDVALHLWRPVALDVDPLADADEIVLGVVIDGERVERTFAGGDEIALDDLRTAPSGGVVSVDVVTSSPDTVARSGPFVVDSTPGHVVGAVLAPVATALLLAAAPGAPRDRAAVCGARDGRVFVVGGAYAGATTPAPGSHVVDPIERLVRDEAGVDDGVGAACTVDEDGVVHVFGGCDADGVPHGRLSRSTDGVAYEEAVDVDGAGACGASIASAGARAAGALVVVAGDLVAVVVEHRVIARSVLPDSRDGASVGVLSADPLRVVVAGGVDDAGIAVAGSVVVTLDGGGESLTTAAGPDVSVVDGTVAVRGDEVVQLLADGAVGATLGVVADGLEAVRVVALPDGRAAVLDAAGALLDVVDDGAPPIAIDPPRPGAAIIPDRGGAIRIIGGGEAGVVVVVPRVP